MNAPAQADEDGPKAHAPGTVLGGKFRVVRVLGAGGMGAVYEIEHELTKHRRALKMLHAEVRRYPSIVTRFLREASAAGRVGNPHIIETFDAGHLDTGDPYVVMELLAGRDLAGQIEKKGPLPLAEIVDLVGQACEGVQAAHDAGIVHRDLKPENLFVVTKDGAPFVKILDFGVSKFDPEATGSMALTTEGSAIGTPYYMSPEQVRGARDIDARADVYALGVILYECATARKPFEAETLPHLSVLISEGKFPPIAETRPDLPRAFSDVVGRAMSSNREHRYQTARELGAALRALVGASAGPDLGATMPAIQAAPPSSVQAPSAYAAMTPAPVSTLGQSAGVESVALGVTTQGSGAPSGSKRPLTVLVASVVVAVVAGVAFLALRPGPPPPALNADAPRASVTPAAPAATPEVTPATTPSASAPPSATPPPPAVGLPVPPRVPPPGVTKPDKPPPSTRVDQKGMVKENPF